MDVMQKIYEQWEEEYGTSPATKEKGCKILEYLYIHCTESVREEVMSMVVEYGRGIERNAFLSGYRQAFELWQEILSFK